MESQQNKKRILTRKAYQILHGVQSSLFNIEADIVTKVTNTDGDELKYYFNHKKQELSIHENETIIYVNIICNT